MMMPSKINDGNLSEELYKEAKDEEKEALTLFLSKARTMSRKREELSTLLQLCGLESRWLNILSDLGLDTYDEVQSKLHDGNLSEELDKEAKDEEKEALRLFMSKARTMLRKRKELRTLLQHCGLESRWLNILNDLGLETYDEVQSKVNEGNLSEELEKEAKGEEKEALGLFLSKARTMSRKRKELNTLLQRCGLESRWLNILNDFGLGTYDEVQSRLNDGNLSEELEKEAKDEEKESLRLFLSKDCKQQIEVRTFKIHLEENGLDADTCSLIFAEEGILTLEDLGKISKNLEIYGKLVQSMNDVEALAVQQVMNIAPGAASEQEVKSILDGVGLESKYWFPIFKDNLGITHPAMLKYVDSSDCQILKSKVRIENETTIIKQYFKHTDALYSERRQNDKKICIERCKEIKRIVKELQELRNKRSEDLDKEGSKILNPKEQKLHDLEIKVKEENIRSLLQIPRTEVQTTLDILEEIKKIDLQSMLNDDLKDVEIVENASDAVLLKGICFATENGEKLAPRKKVLETPPGFSLSKSILSNQKCAQQFSSREQLDFFSTALKNNGYSITVSDRVDNEVFSTSAHFLSKDQEVLKEHTGYALVQYFMIPIASGAFHVDNLFLRKDVLEELKKLEEVAGTLTKDLLYKKCEGFFNEFGTHVNTGQIHFGGIYQWRLSYEGKLIESNELLKRVASDAMEEFVHSEHKYKSRDSVSASELSENFKKKYNECDIENMMLTIETVGGAPSAVSFPQWKTGLIGDSSSWAVIDRGFNVKGIWELLENHKDYFDNHSKVAEILCSAWETKTGLTSGQLPNYKQLVEVPERIHKLCSFVENSITDSVFFQNCESYLDLLNAEKDQITIISRNPNLWQSIVEENPCIVNFLEMVVQNKHKYNKHNFRTIKFMFQQVMQGVDNSTLKSKAIIQWMRSNDSLTGSEMSGCVSIMIQFVSLVKRHIIPRLHVVDKGQSKGIESADDGHRISATNDFAAYVSGILYHLHSSGEHHIAYLMTLLLLEFGYDVKSKGFDKWLSDEDLDRYLTNLEENWKNFIKYRDQSVYTVECYLVHVTLEMLKQFPVDSRIGLKFLQMINHMKLHFSLQVNQMIDQYAKTPVQWDKLESTVQSALFGTPQEEKNHNILEVGIGRILQVTPMAAEAYGTSEFCSSNITMQNKEKSNLFNILEILGLSEFYPGKITLQHLMQTSGDKLDTVNDLPWYIIHKLLMLDYRGRNVDNLSGDVSNKKSTATENENQDETDDIEDDFLNDIFARMMDSSTEATHTAMPHPMDVLIAIFLCSSDFLRQTLAEKMYMCRLSIPILLPENESDSLIYLLWALRNIVCEFELSGGTAVEMPVVSSHLPVVSFVRLGEVSRSKSKLLNDIISNEGHNTFFHRDCASDVMPPKISDGMADVAWLLPAKEDKSKLKEAVTFINLHGNGNSLPLQCQFLSTISSVLIMLVCLEELQNSKTISLIKSLMNSDKKLVLIISKLSDSAPENFKESLTVCLKELGQDLRKQKVIFDFNNDGPKNASKMKNEVIDGIINCLSGKVKITLEESKKVAESFSIVVDESSAKCVAGQVFAKEVFNHVDENNLAATKARMLPLQGDLWRKWGILDKNEHRKEGKAQCSEHYVAKLHEEKRALRCQQLQIFKYPPRLLEAFISKLLQLEGSMRLYFLRWLTIYLDGACRKALPSLIKEYTSKWTEINRYKSKQKDGTDVYMVTLQNELCKLEEKLAMTSLGLEHLMREVGQAFEAVSNLSGQMTQDIGNNIYKLPRIMAELMLSGYPLEIMDGDASHVPLSWVTAVLSELKMVVGDKKIFVLSVLGVQSSGKSTLLNTMFGLQFAVSAGRCTRGVYAQLVPVPKGTAVPLYDYILVVDTEGLRAPELGAAKHQHDNELATLVIGLGDMTIINIKGENPTEMQDVLQIVVHAFLRMQLVNKNLALQPACFFIHQNVGAVNAAAKMIFGQQKLLDNLDKMSVAAADQENVKGIYSFKEVIDFDVEKNVWYFSDLWQGDPPMAPANPGYSEKVHKVKMSILNEIMQKKRSHSNLSSISIRIKDLWKGILCENFVFSFKNSLELRAYGSLESTLTDLSWSLQNDALKWFNNVCNRIMSCEKGLDSLEVNLHCEFSKYFTEIYNKAHSRLSKFFEENEDKDIVEQWKERSMLKLCNRKEETLAITMNALKNEFKVRKLELQQFEKAEAYKDDIQRQAKQLAIKLRGKGDISEEELEREFTCMWTTWMESLSSEQHDRQVCDIGSIVLVTMYDMLKRHDSLLASELEIWNVNDAIQTMHGKFSIRKEHIDLKRTFRFWTVTPDIECFQMANTLTECLFDDIEDYLKSLQGSNFCSTQAVTVIKKTTDAINKANHSKRPFKFTALFSVQLVIFVCRYAVFTFKKIQHDYIQETDPKRSIERNYRGQLLKLFKSTYKSSEKEKTVADMLATCLMEVISKSLKGDMPRELAANVRDSVSCLHTKGDLLKCILKDLLKLAAFDEYQLYLTDIRKCLKKWVRIYTNRYLFEIGESGMSRFTEVASMKMQLHINNICEEIEKATKDVELRKGEDQDTAFKSRDWFQQWLKVFHVGLVKTLPLPESYLSLVSKEQIEDIGFFKENVIQSMISVQQQLKKEAESVTGKQLELQNNSVYDLLERECLGCSEQCPFCRAPCSLTVPNHDVEHSALQHYPQGAGRYRWESSGELVIDHCSTSVCGNCRFMNDDTQNVWHPYSDYKKIYPNWNIQADPSMDTSLYWKHFMAKYIFELAEAYEAKVPNIPHAWTIITPSEAEASLE